MTVKIVYTDQGTILMTASDLMDIPDSTPPSPAPAAPDPQNTPIGDPAPNSDRKVWPRPKSGPGVMIIEPHDRLHERMMGLFMPDNHDVCQVHVDFAIPSPADRLEVLRHTLRTQVITTGAPWTVLNVAVPAHAMQNGTTYEFEKLLEQKTPGLAGIRLFVKDWSGEW